jgi:hypothetical protein
VIDMSAQHQLLVDAVKISSQPIDPFGPSSGPARWRIV